jgi:hypothetical protein
VGQSYNDNINLAPRRQEVGGFITTITPALELTANTPRLTAALTYDPEALIFDSGTFPPEFQERLLGVASAKILPERLFLDTRASIDQAYLTPTGPIGPTTLTTNPNLQQVSAVSATPYLLERLGPYADSETRYLFSYVTVSGHTIAPEEISECLQKFTSGEAFGRLSWAATGDYTHRDLIGDGLIDDGMYRSKLGGDYERQANRFAAEILMPPTRFENGQSGGQAETLRKLQSALETAGVEFIAENGGGPGVRLKKRAFLVTDGGLHHQLAASGNFGQVIRRNYPVAIGNRMGHAETEVATVVGCLCTPLDLLADKVELPVAEVGDLVVVFQSGAYGLSASPVNFLSHPLPVEVLV